MKYFVITSHDSHYFDLIGYKWSSLDITGHNSSKLVLRKECFWPHVAIYKLGLFRNWAHMQKIGQKYQTKLETNIKKTPKKGQKFNPHVSIRTFKRSQGYNLC